MKRMSQMLDTAVMSTDINYHEKGETVAINSKSLNISSWSLLRYWDMSAVVDNVSGLILRSIQQNKIMFDDNDLRTSFYQYAQILYNTRNLLEAKQSDTNSVEVRVIIPKATPDIGNTEIETNPILSIEGRRLGHKTFMISAIKRAPFSGSLTNIE